jgi:hypothetical protein
MFLPVILGRNVIPLTVIGARREIRSSGFVMSVTTTAEVFDWILQWSAIVRPCQGELVTILSDEDVGLRGAFTNSQCPEVRALKRFI